MKSENDRIFLVESSSQIDDLLRQDVAGRGVWIALSPQAMHALRRRGIAYKVPEEFICNEEVGEICQDYHSRLKFFCDHIDEQLRAEHPFLEQKQMRPFLYNIIPLTMLVDGMVSRIAQLQAIIRAYPGCRLWVYKSPPCPWGLYDITFSNKENLWGMILSLAGWECEVKFLSLPAESRCRPAVLRTFAAFKKAVMRIPKKIKDFIGSSFLVYNLAMVLNLRSTAVLSDIFRGKKKKSLLFYGGLYEWKHVLPLARLAGWRIVFMPAPRISSGLPEGGAVTILNRLQEQDQEIMSVFSYGGILFYPLLRERLEWLAGFSDSRCRSITTFCRRIIDRYNVKALMAANAPAFIDHAVEQCFRMNKIPVFTWQHGFMLAQKGKINQLNQFNNMMTADIVYTFGKGPGDAHRKYRHIFSARVIDTGSSSLDLLKKNHNGAEEFFEKTVLYVTTNYYHNRWYSGFFPPFNDRNFFLSQETILRSLNKMARECGARVTVKLANFSSSELALAKEFAPPLYVVHRYPSFTGLINSHHAIIIDSPTTTVLQALATRKAVFVLTSHIQYPSEAQELLSRRAVCADSPEKLMKEVQDYLNRGKYNADIEDTAFLKEYGTCSDDGNSANRVWENTVSFLSGENCFAAASPESITVICPGEKNEAVRP